MIKTSIQKKIIKKMQVSRQTKTQLTKRKSVKNVTIIAIATVITLLHWKLIRK
jgi:hypothetical protein